VSWSFELAWAVLMWKPKDAVSSMNNNILPRQLASPRRFDGTQLLIVGNHKA